MYIGTNVLVYERWLVLKVRYTAGWPNAFAIPYSHCLCMWVENAFSILSTNIQSVNAQFDKLNFFFYRILEKRKFIFNAICILESWLTDDADTSHIELEGYTCISQVGSCSSKGGLIIYLQDKFEYTYRNKLTNYDTWEGIQVKKGELLNKPIIIGNIYHSPRDIVEKYSEFTNEFAHVYVLDTLETMRLSSLVISILIYQR